MPTELKFDAETARTLAQTGQRMKPKKGVTRAYQVKEAFVIQGDQQREAGDYIVVMPNGVVKSASAGYVNDHFEPVKKRTKKGKANAKTV